MFYLALSVVTSQKLKTVKVCVCYIFASLFFNSKQEHLSNLEKFFFFASKALFILKKIKF